MKRYIYPKEMVDGMLKRGYQLVKVGTSEFLADKNGGIMGGDPVTIGLAVTSMGISLYGTSRARQDAAKAQAGQLAFDARTAKLESKAILEEAALEAIEIRREGELLGKKQTALTAKAGLKLGRGTAKDIQTETKRLTEKDVTTTLEGAERRSERLLKTYPEGKTALEGDGILKAGNFIKNKVFKNTVFGKILDLGGIF